MQKTRKPSGSSTRWGPLFGARARDWAETWEGPSGYGTPLYERVLDRAKVESGTRVLDCGCGAGRFARMAADRGARVAGIDAAEGLVAIAAERTPTGDFRVGDLEALPWPDGSFDVVTGFNAFQFADDKARALAEARRVSLGPIAVVIPTRPSESGVAFVFKPLFPLFPPEALESMKQSGIFALAEPGKLEQTLAAAGLTALEDEEIKLSIIFENADAAERAFVGAGPTALAIRHAGEQAVAAAGCATRLLPSSARMVASRSLPGIDWCLRAPDPDRRKLCLCGRSLVWWGSRMPAMHRLDDDGRAAQRPPSTQTSSPLLVPGVRFEPLWT